MTIPRPAPSIYSVHSAVAHVQAILRNLAKTTGRNLPAWVACVHEQGLHDLQAAGSGSRI